MRCGGSCYFVKIAEFLEVINNSFHIKSLFALLILRGNIRGAFCCSSRMIKAGPLRYSHSLGPE